MTADTYINQDGNEDSTSGVDAAAVETLARAAGLRLERQRAEIVAPFVTDALRADAALARLDMGDAAAAGPPWGGDADDA